MMLRRIRYWLGSAERARLLREEMEIHLEMKVQELMEDGMTESDARGAARRQFGNFARKQEESRETWIAGWLGDLLQDTVYAVRLIRKQPGFAAVAVISAALGIGACSLIFGLANFALFRPLPVENPSRLESISGKSQREKRAGMSMAYPDFNDLCQARSFEDMTAYFSFLPATISSGGEPQRYWGTLATANYFDVVRPSFALGRGFDPGRDDVTGEPPVVVLSYSLWRSRFQGDPAMVGRDIELNGRKATVIGVTGPEFRGTEVMSFSDFWIPFSMLDSVPELSLGVDRIHNRDGQWLAVIGRLRDGVGAKTAASEIDVISQRLSAAFPGTNRDRSFHAERAGQLNPGLRNMIVLFFLMLLGVAALVLCTACANVANLLLARASARQKEIATRLAIGAGRGRLVRQLLTESVMLALLGGIGGYAIARMGAAAIGRFQVPIALPVGIAVSLDDRVMVFCMALSTMTGLIFGLVPALRATRPDLVGALKDERVRLGQSRRFGLRNVLVVAQVTVCMVLLICSGLFLRSLYSAGHIETGFANRNLLMLGFDPNMTRHSAGDTRHIVDAVLEDTSAMAGVESSSISSSVPLNLEGTHNWFVPADGANRRISADIYSIAPRFFETLGIRMIDGQDFRQGASADDIVIVNQAAADQAFHHQNPIGRRILYFGRTVRIVGLVATTKSHTIGEDPRPILYFPMTKDLRGNDSLTGMTLVLRTRGDPAGYASLVRETIRKIDPSMAVFDVRTMDMQLSRALLLPRSAAFLFGVAGLVGLLIATVGIYGVISFSVAQQSKEIGIRMALGAMRGQVLGMVLRQGLALTAAGCAIGVGLSMALARMAASLLYGVSPIDAVTFLCVPPILLLVALAACLIPAQRAASLDPIGALKYE
jgi:predicted permease